MENLKQKTIKAISALPESVDEAVGVNLTVFSNNGADSALIISLNSSKASSSLCLNVGLDGTVVIPRLFLKKELSLNGSMSS